MSRLFCYSTVNNINYAEILPRLVVTYITVRFLTSNILDCASIFPRIIKDLGILGDISGFLGFSAPKQCIIRFLFWLFASLVEDSDSYFDFLQVYAASDDFKAVILPRTPVNAGVNENDSHMTTPRIRQWFSFAPRMTGVNDNANDNDSHSLCICANTPPLSDDNDNDSYLDSREGVGGTCLNTNENHSRSLCICANTFPSVEYKWESFSLPFESANENHSHL